MLDCMVLDFFARRRSQIKRDANSSTAAPAADYLSVDPNSRLSNIVQEFTGIQHQLGAIAEAAYIEIIRGAGSSKPRIGLVCPTRSFVANFGDISLEMQARGWEVHYLIGDVELFDKIDVEFKWLVINDMMRRLEGFQVVLSASVMDCLPRESIRVLHDHLSFAHFDMEHSIAELPELTYLPSNLSREQYFELVPAFVSFLPHYDLVLSPNEGVSALTGEALALMGYSQEDRECDNTGSRSQLRALTQTYRDERQDREIVRVCESGYLKLDVARQKFKESRPESVILYCPTPEDPTNKTTRLWDKALSSREFGANIVSTLCAAFPGHSIVYKPYAGESSDIVKIISEVGRRYPNFSIDKSGSDYWDLYSRAKVMVSDFSSTAYTFAIGMGRPVAFFSPREVDLPPFVQQGAYCASRTRVGAVAPNLAALTQVVQDILDNYDHFTARVGEFAGLGTQSASSLAADAIVSVFEGHRPPRSDGSCEEWYLRHGE